MTLTQFILDVSKFGDLNLSPLLVMLSAKSPRLNSISTFTATAPKHEASFCSTRPAKSISVTLLSWAPAYWTRFRHVLFSILFPPMLRAQPQCSLTLAANGTFPTMQCGMANTVLTKNQIFNTIVRLNLVYVMNLLQLCERPSNVIRHHQPVLKNIPCFVRVWMVWGKNEDVSV